MLLVCTPIQRSLKNIILNGRSLMQQSSGQMGLGMYVLIYLWFFETCSRYVVWAGFKFSIPLASASQVLGLQAWSSRLFNGSIQFKFQNSKTNQYQKNKKPWLPLSRGQMWEWGMTGNAYQRTFWVMLTFSVLIRVRIAGICISHYVYTDTLK